MAAQYLKVSGWLTTFDLKSGYHHIDIHPDYWPYLGFSWKEGEERAFYVFKVLPFRLATACYVFSKVLRPLVSRWRSMGIKMVLYLDDGLCTADSECTAAAHTNQVMCDLKACVLVVNHQKSHLEPQRKGKWLGVFIDLDKGIFYIPEDKIRKLCAKLSEAIMCGTITARNIAKITGSIMSMSIALGSIVRLRTRYMYSMINQRRFWNEKLELTTEAKNELEFWLGNLRALNGRPFRWSPSATRVVYSDASDSGYGGYTVELGPHVSYGQWTEKEAQHSSTWRELKAVDRILQAFAVNLEGHTVKWYTDNQNVVGIIQHGSRKLYLQDGAMCIYERCTKHAIKLEMAWIPRGENEIADYLSRLVDYDDWQVDPTLFRWLDNMWGPFTVDNFADNNNTQLPTFHCKCWCPQALVQWIPSQPLGKVV